MRKFFLISFIILISDISSAEDNKTIILGTTTSVQDSGLLDFLVPVFEKASGYVLKPIAVGTGESLALGRRGEVDVLLVHSPEDEIKFVAVGYGTNRRVVMFNYFVLAGPEDDPLNLKGKTLVSALKLIVSSKSPFVSRGDNSGTHKKEKSLWRDAGVAPDKGAYIETGQGMADTLRIASHKLAYTLTDLGTYLAVKESLDLEILVESSGELLNTYSVIEVNPEKFSRVNKEGAGAFIEFMVSDKTQSLIRDFGKDKYGKPLFFPVNAVPIESD